MGDAKAAVEPNGPARLPDPPSFVLTPAAGAPVLWTGTVGPGAGNRAHSYPRRGGVIVPPELARFCQGVVAPPRVLAAESDAAADMAKIAARAVVQRMARAAHGLPRALLDLKLPSPALALETYVVDDRTRRVLERATPGMRTRNKMWTLAAYLELPRFGPFCLVDLLAARAEAITGLPPQRTDRDAHDSRRRAAGDAAGAPGLLPLGEVSALLMREMPLASDQVAKLLRREGVPLAVPTVRELARAYRRAGQAVPFRIIRHRGCDVVVAPSGRNIARTVLVAATQFISWWGLTTVQQIVTRAQLCAATSVSAAFAARVLASFPRVEWLDPSREWFSFRGNSSALLRAIRKAFAATDRVELPLLGRALSKEKALLAKLPAGVWERYLSAIAGCTIDGIWVRRQAGDDGLCPA